MEKTMAGIFLSLILFAISLLSPFVSNAFAYAEKASGSSAVLVKTTDEIKSDYRAKVLRKYLESFDSPLSDSAETFVKAADENNIDWKLVAAISGVESTFAHHLPYNSYNAWGWGIYGDNMIYFKSYDDGINIISKSLRENYINRLGTDDVYVIGKMYAASPTWAQRVEYFMNKMDKFALDTTDTLSISL